MTTLAALLAWLVRAAPDALCWGGELAGRGLCLLAVALEWGR